MNEERVSWGKHSAKQRRIPNVSQGAKSAVAYTFASLFSKGLAFITVPIFYAYHVD